MKKRKKKCPESFDNCKDAINNELTGPHLPLVKNIYIYFYIISTKNNKHKNVIFLELFKKIVPVVTKR